MMFEVHLNLPRNQYSRRKGEKVNSSNVTFKKSLFFTSHMVKKKTQAHSVDDVRRSTAAAFCDSHSRRESTFFFKLGFSSLRFSPRFPWFLLCTIACLPLTTLAISLPN
nr:hypothetical protein Iba_chr14aCG11890 [Ipomoea batatas]